MSTITAIPAPVVNRTPLYVALGLIGVVAAAAVVVPNLTTSSVTTTTVPAPSAFPRSGGPDVAERAGVAEQLRAEARLDRLAKSQRSFAGITVAAAAIPTSVVAEQVGGLHRTYAFTGTTGYSSLRESQVPGSRPNYVYRPSADHMVWNDRFVPPFDNPTWAEAIQKHYFGTGTAS
jgi:hypothetical protein